MLLRFYLKCFALVLYLNRNAGPAICIKKIDLFQFLYVTNDPTFQELEAISLGYLNLNELKLLAY